MHPLTDWNFKADTSFSIMAECHRRNHTLYFLQSQDLLLHGRHLHALLYPCAPEPDKGLSLQKGVLRRLDALDCLFIRKEPPFDEDYLACTYLLDFVREKIFLINDSTGIRTSNEKLCSLHSSLMPETIVGYRPDALVRSMRSLRLREVVLKKLYDKGGKGIIRAGLRDSDLQRKIRKLKNSAQTPLMVQKFVPHAHTGDKRILLLDGDPLGAFTRIPSGADFRANMSLGGLPARTRITPKERKIIRSIRSYLKQNRLYFVGMDVLDGYLTEINVTSPAGIPEINDLEGTHLEKQVVDFIEKMS